MYSKKQVEMRVCYTSNNIFDCLSVNLVIYSTRDVESSERDAASVGNDTAAQRIYCWRDSNEISRLKTLQEIDVKHEECR